MNSGFTRRDLLKSIPALAATPRLMGQAKSTLPVRGFSHMTISVTDPKRSLEFYQGLFGMPIQVRQGNLILLQIGSGPQFIALGSAGANGKPEINHYCMQVDNFSVDRVTKVLEAHGISKAEATGGGLSGGPLKYRVRVRTEAQGGAKDGTPEFYMGDPDGLIVQLQDVKYCGGAGSLGEVCYAKPEPSPTKGVLAVKDLSHFTLFVPDAAKSLAFYQDVFAMPVSAHQGATPLLGVGAGGPFLTLAGAGGGRAGATPRPASINHVCFRMENFNPDKVLKTLEDFGIKPRAGNGPAGPLQSYVTPRMENRGGAKDGTPELYFTDPDGILLQVQDMSYCGGAGALGQICTP